MISIRFHQQDGSSTLAARAVGLAATLLVVLLTYLSVDPEAHEYFHHDADGAHHHCVISAYAAGEALLLAADSVLGPIAASAAPVQWRAAEFLRIAVEGAPVPICGPPPPFGAA